MTDPANQVDSIARRINTGEYTPEYQLQFGIARAEQLIAMLKDELEKVNDQMLLTASRIKQQEEELLKSRFSQRNQEDQKEQIQKVIADLDKNVKEFGRWLLVIKTTA